MVGVLLALTVRKCSSQAEVGLSGPLLEALRVTPLGRRVFTPCTSRAGSAQPRACPEIEVGRCRSQSQTLEGMARPAGSPGAQGTPAAEVGRGGAKAESRGSRQGPSPTEVYTRGSKNTKPSIAPPASGNTARPQRSARRGSSGARLSQRRAPHGRRAGALVETAAAGRNQRSAAARSKRRLLSTWTRTDSRRRAPDRRSSRIALTALGRRHARGRSQIRGMKLRFEGAGDVRRSA